MNNSNRIQFVLPLTITGSLSAESCLEEIMEHIPAGLPKGDGLKKVLRKELLAKLTGVSQNKTGETREFQSENGNLIRFALIRFSFLFLSSRKEVRGNEEIGYLLSTVWRMEVDEKDMLEIPYTISFKGCRAEKTVLQSPVPGFSVFQTFLHLDFWVGSYGEIEVVCPMFASCSEGEWAEMIDFNQNNYAAAFSCEWTVDRNTDRMICCD